MPERLPERLIDLNIREKRFGDRPVLGHTALTVARGEIVSLVGASGCGKSTLLRIVAGLDTAYDGTVSVLGHEPRLHARDVGFVFQEPRLLPWLTVAQNVGFERGAKGAKDPLVQTLLAEVGLDGQGAAYPKELSGGMAQRAAIARALFSRPDILLLDEPFSAVDPFTRMNLQDLLLSVAERHGATLLVVTHDIAEAVYLSDRVLAVANRARGIAGEVEISIRRPRDRHDPTLSPLQSRVLSLLEETRQAAA
jgi:sulfonate transport system ATP-binding protein